LHSYVFELNARILADAVDGKPVLAVNGGQLPLAAFDSGWPNVKIKHIQHAWALEHSHYRGWRAKNAALLDLEMDDGISVNVPLIVSVAVVQQLVSFGGPLPIWCVIKKTETTVFSQNWPTTGILDL